MGKNFIFILAAFALFLLPIKALAAESIDKYYTNIQLNRDGSVQVEENILYDFGDAERHGIYRDITVAYKARGGNYKLRVSDISVTDEFDNQYNFESSYPGNYLRLKIGDADKTISGRHWYKISYTVKRGINYFSDHEELYWNATGNEWQVPIGEAKTTVYLPGEFDENEIQRTCYFGGFGSQSVCDIGPISSEQPVSVLEFSAYDLGPSEGLTVVVGVPSGTIAKPPLASVIWEIVRDNIIILVPIFVFIWLFRRWKKHGKDAKGRGTIIPEYEAPDNLTPAEVGTLLDGRADRHDVSAEIIELAIQGYLKIRRIEAGTVFKSTDFVFIKLKSADDLKKQFDKDIMNGIFEKGDEVKLSDLKYKFYSVMNAVMSKLYSDLTSQEYFVKNPSTVKAKYFISAAVVFFLAFFVGAFFGVFGVVAIILSAIIIIIFGFLMVALTKKGAEAKEKIFGLKMYLSVAEKARIEFHNAPKKNPEQFEKFLPYAMVMKVEKEWAKQFEGIYNTQPDWYEDPAHRGMFNAATLVGVMSSFDSSASSALAANPSSASSGGSGFSGGGSGGGFGGGGGGSW